MLDKKERLKILKFVQENKDTSSNDIAESLNYKHETVIGSLNYLEEKKMIEHGVESVEGNLNLIKLRAKGVDFLEESSVERKDVFIGKTLRAFISYSDKDKLIAGAIKEALNHYGTEAFLAHEDIPPGEEWADKIMINLKQCDILIPLLSKNFVDSEWTDQETGIAVANSKLIVPISIDGTIPYGFMNKYQAFRNFKYQEHELLKGEKYISCYKDVFKIIEYLSKKGQFKENIKDCLISSLKNSGSFREAESIMNLLVKLKPFSQAQINQIIKNSSSNRQVYDAHGCQSEIKKLFGEYAMQITLKNKKEISNMTHSPT